jgi:DNA polymerase-3 subunit beta
LHLAAHDGVLDVTGSDGEVSIRVRVEQVEVHKDGEVLVNAARFLQILRELSGERVEVETDERAGCVIHTSDARFQFMGEVADDYPEQAPWPKEGAFRLAAGELVEMIRRTQFAAHPGKTRYAINGILLDLNGSRVRLVATDGKRLSMCERTLEFEAESPIRVVVPTKGMTLLQRVVKTGEESVEVSVAVNPPGPHADPEAVRGGWVQFRASTALVTARLVEGHFPPYEDVLPKDRDKKLTLPRESFLYALRQAALLGAKDRQAVRFKFDREGIELTAWVPEVGESRASFSADYPYDTLEIGFNPSYFADVLKVLTTSEVTLELKDARSAVVIREGRDTHVIMPLNLEGV